MKHGFYVIKRNGEKQPIDFDKIIHRLKNQTSGLDISQDEIDIIAQSCVKGFSNGMNTCDIDELLSSEISSLCTKNPDMSFLASRITISNLHRKYNDKFSTFVYNNSMYFSEQFIDTVKTFSDQLDDMIVRDRDYLLTYFGFKTLEKKYLMNNELPQFMFMRTSIQVFINDFDIEKVKRHYDLTSMLDFTHASPTLFNSGYKYPQLSSCFLGLMKEDSIEGIYDTLKDCAMISKFSGGIGLNVTKIRSKNTNVMKTNGKSNGIVPMLKVFNSTGKYVDQGGKRPGSIAIYLEPWHADIEDFLLLRRNNGDENMRSRDLFYALWICDIFMERVKEGGKWSLFSPSDVPLLLETYGKEFERLYIQYESEGKYVKQIDATELFYTIMDSQIETGSPYMLYKDSVNMKNMQSNIGMINSSNLCAEIVEHTSPDEWAVCNLSNIALNKFIKDGEFDFDRFGNVVQLCVESLDNIIDVNFYPIDEAHKSNSSHRPIGLGVQGLADVFMELYIPFDCLQARELNVKIFECMYYNAVVSSNRLAMKKGKYSTFEGSHYSKGILNPDIWCHDYRGTYDWCSLRKNVKEYGMRNSLLIAIMPTASTSNILGNNECIEPITSNIYTRTTGNGRFQIVNKYLVKRLKSINKWNDKVRSNIINNNGSVSGLDVDSYTKAVFKTVWETSQKSIIDMAADRSPFVDQSQSMNLFMSDPTYDKLSSMHFYSWNKGLKTGMYYLRSRAATQTIKYTTEYVECDDEICYSCQ